MRIKLFITVIFAFFASAALAQNSKNDLIAFSSDATKENKQQIFCFLCDMSNGTFKRFSRR